MIKFKYKFIRYKSFLVGTSGTTSMLLITDYHTIGSLYDFLKNYELTEEQLVSKSYFQLSKYFVKLGFIVKCCHFVECKKK